MNSVSSMSSSHIRNIFFPRYILEKNKIINYFLLKVNNKLYLDKAKLDSHPHGQMIRCVLLNHTDLEIYDPTIHS
jgi:hypothetical protein